MAKVLVIDDEKSIRNTLRDILEYEKYTVDDAPDALQAIEMLAKQTYDVILCDIKMPKLDGIEALEKMQELTEAPIIMISGHGTIDTAVSAIKKGAYDFIAKPLDLNRLLITLRNALERCDLVKENKTLKKKVARKYAMIGASTGLQQIQEMINKVAPTDARVLILGDNGTGKELVAHNIHEQSNRVGATFIEVNCAAIPSELIESELFGHEKGAFTSAIKQRMGCFEQANGGTLFLDEIGDMSLSAQAKVLRALQENKVTRVGGEKDITVNVRVLAATNKNLETEIAEGHFREDLYHRLSVVIIRVPSLNNRSEDIGLLAEHFMQEICLQQGKPTIKITDKAIAELQKINWRGNIRQLRNVIERLSIFCDKQVTDKDVVQYQ